MKKLLTLTAAAALLAAFGFAGTAMADPFADFKENFAPGTGSAGDGSEALGGPSAGDGSFVTLGDGGILILQFTDNLCLDDGTGAFEFRVVEDGNDEGYTAEVGLTSVGTLPFLSGTVNGNTSFDVGGAVSFFNRIRITDDNDGVDGADIDAVECFFTLDQADIVKAFADNPQDGGASDEIDVRVKGEDDTADQQFKAFTLKITNDTGIDNAFTGLTFFDAVPAEYDLDPLGEDLADGGGIDSCASGDGTCNGIAEDTNGKCTVTADVPQGAKAGHGGNKLLTKLEPELLSIDASALLDTEMCTTTVYVKTDLGAHKKMFTPTSCPVDLNSGVKVFDVLKNLLLQDDDQPIFDDGAGGLVGMCNDVLDND